MSRRVRYLRNPQTCWSWAQQRAAHRRYVNNDIGPAGRENTNHNEDVDRQVAPKVHYGRPQLPVGGVGKVTVIPNATGFQAHASTRDASGARKRIKASASTAEEAERLVRSKAAGLAFVPGELTGASTLGELLDVWLAEVVATRNIRPQTMQMYRTKVNRLQRDFGAIELSGLRPRRMQIVVNDLARRMKASEFQTLRGILRQAFRYAVRAELVTANHLDAIESVRPAEQGPPIALTVEQVQVFRKEFAAYVSEGKRDSNRHKAQLVVDIILGLGGLRISEALALRHCDVDFEKNTANINGTLVYIAEAPAAPVEAEAQRAVTHREVGARRHRHARTSRGERTVRIERARARDAPRPASRNRQCG